MRALVVSSALTLHCVHSGSEPHDIPHKQNLKEKRAQPSVSPREPHDLVSLGASGRDARSAMALVDGRAGLSLHVNSTDIEGGAKRNMLKTFEEQDPSKHTLQKLLSSTTIISDTALDVF